MAKNERTQGIDETMPVQEIINDFFADREKTSAILFQLWNMFALALESENVDNDDNIMRANMCFDFERLFLLVLRLGRYREKRERNIEN